MTEGDLLYASSRSLSLGAPRSNMHEGILARFDNRDLAQGAFNVLDVLLEEEFFSDDLPVVDFQNRVREPCVAVGLLERLGRCEYHLVGAIPYIVKDHYDAYQRIKANHYPDASPEFRESWLLGEVVDEPALVRGKAVIVHHEITEARKTDFHPEIPENMRNSQVIYSDTDWGLALALRELCYGRPARIALYTNDDEERHHSYKYETRTRLMHRVLESEQLSFRRIDNLPPADFETRESGVLFLIDKLNDN